MIALAVSWYREIAGTCLAARDSDVFRYAQKAGKLVLSTGLWWKPPDSSQSTRPKLHQKSSQNRKRGNRRGARLSRVCPFDFIYLPLPLCPYRPEMFILYAPSFNFGGFSQAEAERRLTGANSWTSIYDFEYRSCSRIKVLAAWLVTNHTL
jgi:hypothetical protein